MTLPQAIRLAAVSAGGANIGFTAIVFYVYFLAWRRSPRERGLLPRYVVGVSTFAIVTESIFIWAIADLLRRQAPLTPLAPAVLVANTILTLSLIDIFRFERRRVSAANRPIVADPPPMRRAEDHYDATWWGQRKVKKRGDDA